MKSEYLAKRIDGLVRTIKPMVHEENRDTVGKALELYILRLVMDMETIHHSDISDLNDRDFNYFENI